MANNNNKDNRVQLYSDPNPKLSNTIVYRQVVPYGDNVLFIDGIGVLKTRYNTMQNVILYVCLFIIISGIAVMIFFLCSIYVMSEDNISHAILLIVVNGDIS